MNDRSWAPLEEVIRLSAGLPMPENYWMAEDNDEIFNDGLYIHTQLSRLTLSQRSKAASAYAGLYSGVDSRRECNNRLREFADRCVATNSGVTKKPRSI